MKRVLFAALIAGAAIGSVQADEADYGADWPVCRNLREDPKVERDACTRLIDGRKLSQMHLAWAYNNRGTAWQDLGRLDLAEQDFIKSGEIWPANWQAFYNLGLQYSRTERDAEALVMVDRAIEQIGARSVGLYTLRAELRRDKSDVEAALADLNMALALGPDYYDALRDRGAILTGLKRYDEALVDLNRAVAVAPDFSDSRFWRANAELWSGATQAALDDCRYALTLAPDHTPCILVALRAAFILGDFGAAVDSADRLPARYFPAVPLYRNVALVGLGRVDEAASGLRAYTVAEPNDPYGWLWLYLVDRRLGKEMPVELKGLAARRDAWPTPIFRYIVGAATADDVLAAADVPDVDIRSQRLAEANFYLGELAALEGDAAKSSAYKKAGLAVGYADIDPLKFIPVYDDNNALELGMAAARPAGDL